MPRRDPARPDDDSNGWGPEGTGQPDPDWAAGQPRSTPPTNPYLASLPEPDPALPRQPGPPRPAPAPRRSAGGTGQPPGRRTPPSRQKKTAGILLITMAAALILTAAGVAGYPFYTDIQAARHQKALQAQFAREAGASGDARLKLLQKYQQRQFANGEGLTKIVIPAINVSSIVVEGTSDQALAVGAGHYPQTPLPGEVGNVGIAGHRTMNGHPFGDLDKLVPGDRVILETPFTTYTYELVAAFGGHANPWVSSPTDWSVISFPTQDKLLTLTTCNPKGQQTSRLVARAKLVSTQQV